MSLGKYIAITCVALLVLMTYFNYANEQKDRQLIHAYYGWLLETKEGRMPFLEWKALYGEKYKNGKP